MYSPLSTKSREGFDCFSRLFPYGLQGSRGRGGGGRGQGMVKIGEKEGEHFTQQRKLFTSRCWKGRERGERGWGWLLSGFVERANVLGVAGQLCREV